MKFYDLLAYAKEYKEELKTLSGLRDFLEQLDGFNFDELNAFEMIREDLNINESCDIVAQGNYRTFNNVYDLVEQETEYLFDIDKLPNWLRIDYMATFEDLKDYSNYICFGDPCYNDILEYWY